MRILILFIFFAFQNFAQSKRIESNIKKIDNNQFYIEHNSIATFSINSTAARKLIKIGKKATEKLITALNDSNKVIMAHLVLSHIYFKYVSFAGPKTVSYSNGDVLKYYLGEEKGEGLLISEMKIQDGFYRKYIEAKDLEKIKEYWGKKINQK